MRLPGEEGSQLLAGQGTDTVFEPAVHRRLGLGEQFERSPGIRRRYGDDDGRPAPPCLGVPVVVLDADGAGERRRAPVMVPQRVADGKAVHRDPPGSGQLPDRRDRSPFYCEPGIPRRTSIFQEGDVEVSSQFAGHQAP